MQGSEGLLFLYFLHLSYIFGMLIIMESGYGLGLCVCILFAHICILGMDKI